MARRTSSRVPKSSRGGLREPDEAQSPNPIDIYNELLAEAASSPGQESDRPLKRRKVWKPRAPGVAPGSPNLTYNATENGLEQQGEVQTSFSETEQSEEDDFDWEDVALQQEVSAPSSEAESIPVSKGVTLNLEDDKPGKAKSKQKTLGPKLDKATRIQAHKAHFLGLLVHVFIRNAWCNDQQVQETVKRLVPSKIRSLLSPDPGSSQYNQDRFFKEGLNDLKDIWKLNFRPTKQGIKMPSWPSYLQPRRFRLAPNTERLIDIKDFRHAAKTLEGSQDTGVQLLCAVLRSLGVETRLVCSLQPLNLTVSPKDSQLSAAGIPGEREDAPENTASSDAENSRVIQADDDISNPPRRKRRLGQASLGPTLSQPPSKIERKRIYTTRYPIYWVEALNAALQKWTPVEPFSTDTVGRPTKLEPPATQGNGGVRMVYVVAFEEDGVAKDVTKRYASRYNAKTRRERIESIEGGEKWLKRAMRVFRRRRGETSDRDQIEAAELAKKEAQEGMPRAIQDFKDHPLYILERHLKRNEVIHPKREVGKVGVTGKSEKLESVYRRRDVKAVRSADKWYRFGREIVAGEQPLKHLTPKKPSRGLEMSNEIDVDADGDGLGTPLYASFQTQVYTPPPCARGRVPKNAFGNIDIYVPSMVPPGGKHVRDAEASRAAKLIGIDYADAVIGFEFKGRHGTAVTQGIVVAQEYAAAIEVVLESVEYEREQNKEDARSILALRMWKKFLVGLRVLQRVNEYEIEGEKGALPEVDRTVDSGGDDVDADESMDRGGGFFPDNQQNVALPTGKSTRRIIDESEAEEDLSDSISCQDDTKIESPKCLTSDDAGLMQDGGGFLVEDDGEGGGFFPDESFNSDVKTTDFPDLQLHESPDGGTTPAPFEDERFSPDGEESHQFSPGSRADDSRLPLRRTDQEDTLLPDANEVLNDSSNVSPTDDFETHIALAKSMEMCTEESQAVKNSIEQSWGIDSSHGPPSRRNSSGSNEQRQSTRGSDGMALANESKASLDSGAVKEFNPQTYMRESSDDSDRGSLLSHDPEDEEADPDWLAEI